MRVVFKLWMQNIWNKWPGSLWNHILLVLNKFCSHITENIKNQLLQNITEMAVRFDGFTSVTAALKSKVRWSLAQMIMGEKSMFWSANKHSNELYTAILVAFSIPSSVQRKLFLFIVLPQIQQKGEELRDRPIGN